jgi:hypothetical protein
VGIRLGPDRPPLDNPPVKRGDDVAQERVAGRAMSRIAESPLPEATGPLPYPGGGLNQYALAVAFTGAACDHVQSIASQAGYAGVGDHHAGGYSHGHGGGFGGGQMGGGGHHG